MAGTELFSIETDQFSLSWSLLKSNSLQQSVITNTTSGLLNVKPQIPIATSISVSRFGQPAACDLSDISGPHLFEETDYVIRLTSKSGDRTQLMHRDPALIQAIGYKSGDKDIVATINFRSQVGYSDFSVLCGDSPALSFIVEVFPSKLDYRSDYEEMLAEVQDVLTALAIDYLKATYSLGAMETKSDATGLEWLILLRTVADDLERALQQIARHPIRGLRREGSMTRAEKIRRADASVRSAVRRGAGSGERITLDNGLTIRQFLPEHKVKATLDTPEHRWLAAQIGRICQRVAQLRSEESRAKQNPRRQKTIAELDSLEVRMRRLSALEPLTAAEGNPPPGFASLQLLGAPGYREAFQKCIVLMLGLRIEGGPLNLSTKDVSELYEYWCFIALIRLIEEVTGAKLPAKSLFRIRQQGLSVLLEKGKCTAVPFALPNGRSVTAEYNPSFKGDLFLAGQRPDIVLTLKDPQWPELKLVLDAKYRIDTSSKYQEQYRSVGPPEDALNVLHRYRDAILVEDAEDRSPKRPIVQAAALFPYRDRVAGSFKGSRLWKSLEKIGIGAVPLLPGETGYLSEWLRETLRQSGWNIAERAIGNIADNKASDWRQAAAEAVLVAPLRGENAAEHLHWIRSKNLYYIPLKVSQRRFHETRWIAFYLPTELRKPGAVVYWARIEGMEVMTRKEIITPWPAKRDLDEQMFVYRLGEFQTLKNPVTNATGIRVSGHRWSTRLGLLRASLLQELFLETEPEWRLYESLKAADISFAVEADDAKVLDPNNPRGRAWFVVGEHRIQYRGSGGFLLKSPFTADQTLSNADAVIRLLLQ